LPATPDAATATTTTTTTTTTTAAAAAAAPSPPRTPAQAAAGHERAFPDLDRVHGIPGFWHLGALGFLSIIFKVYFPYLLRFVAHDVLHRKHVTANITNFFVCNELFYHTWEAMFELMVAAHKRSTIFRDAKASITSGEAYADNFIDWLDAGIESGDEIFCFYAGYVFGIGAIYRHMQQAIKNMDAPLVWALLLPLLGFCALANKFNLRLQCAMTLIKFFSVDSEVLRAMMSNAFLMFSAHAYHAKAADDGLETKQGYVKPMKKWSLRMALVNTACDPLFARVRAAPRTQLHATNLKSPPRSACRFGEGGSTRRRPPPRASQPL
jgi:hypothetical protein